MRAARSRGITHRNSECFSEPSISHRAILAPPKPPSELAMLFFISQPVFFFVLAAIIAVLLTSLAALWQSRFGSSSVHRFAFCSGFAGLVAIPTALLGLIGVLRQPLTAKMLSIEAFALLGGTFGAFMACFASYSAVLLLRAARPAATSCKTAYKSDLSHSGID